MVSVAKKKLLDRRTARVRLAIRKKNKNNRLRLSIFRSNQHIYAQLIDDQKGETVVSASTMEKELRSKLKAGANIEAAKEVGQLIATRAIKKKIEKVVFDKGGNLFHGRIKALAEAAREKGLVF